MFFPNLLPNIVKVAIFDKFNLKRFFEVNKTIFLYLRLKHSSIKQFFFFVNIIKYSFICSIFQIILLKKFIFI